MITKIEELPKEGFHITGIDWSNRPHIYLFPLKKVAELPQLRWLDLSGTPVDDDSIMVLSKMPRLRKLDLTETLVSRKVVRQLSGRRPQLEVSWSDFKHD